MSDHALARFIEAQAPVLQAVTEELRAGRKRSHWMWYVFPQLKGLGHSSMAMNYGIRDLGEAQRYLAHPILGERLLAHVKLMLGHKSKSAHYILGSPDDMKFRSCLTLFETASSDSSEHRVFSEALQQFYNGVRDPKTLEILRLD